MDALRPPVIKVDCSVLQAEKKMKSYFFALEAWLSLSTSFPTTYEFLSPILEGIREEISC
jgi:hypothetical protein